MDKQPYSTVNVFKKDRKKFEALLNGVPAVRFMNRMIDEKSCRHPVSLRVQLTAIYHDGDAISQADPMSNKTVHGYYCPKCATYVIPAPEV